MELCKYILANIRNEREFLNAIPRTLTILHEEEEVNIRNLLSDPAIININLIQKVVEHLLYKGSLPVRCIRDCVQTVDMLHDIMQVPVRIGDRYAHIVKQGAEIPKSDFTYVTLRSDPSIEILIIPAGHDIEYFMGVLPIEIMECGKELERRLNQDVIAAMLEGTGTTVEYQGIKALSAAIKQVKNSGFIPDTIVMSPEFECTLPCYNWNGRMLGCTISVCPTLLKGDFGAIVYNKYAFARLGLRKDLFFDDSKGTAIMRYSFEIVPGNETAACKIML
jgi:hypothetical protein